LGKIDVNLAQDVVKDCAVVLKAHPQFKPIQRAMIRSRVKNRIADVCTQKLSDG